MAAQNQPAAEIEITAELVRGLLVAQHPDLAERPLQWVARGWDNELFRLGDDLVVRLPRRDVAATLVRHEHRWLPSLALELPLPIPAPIRRGEPGAGFPWWWTIAAWFDGALAATAVVDDPVREGRRLGGFLHALHREAPADAPLNPVRGGPLAGRTEVFSRRLDQLAGELDVETIGRTWELLSSTEPHRGPPVWLHGDLHPANLIVRDGELAAVIDFGDLTSGDPATDLAIGWMWFEGEARDAFRQATGADELTWRRAQAWALHLAVAFLANSADNSTMAAVGRRTLSQAMAD
jgi:aminoglycoside phosphotransferase (APT) family kinase protein